MASRAHQLRGDRLASDQITEAPALVDPGRRHGAEHTQEPVMPTVHVGAALSLHAVGGSPIGGPRDGSFGGDDALTARPADGMGPGGPTGEAAAGPPHR